MSKQTYSVCFCWRRRFKLALAEAPSEIKTLFEDYAENEIMTPSHLKRFLVEVQKQEKATEEEAQVIIDSFRHFHRRSVGLNLESFFKYLFSDDNPPLIPSRGVHHDMTLPLSHYFIYTGHNSYLTGNQLSSDCSDVPIINALKRGVRVIELDIWPNATKDNIDVLHGRTLTAPVELIRCLRSIKEHAFVASEYPVVITLEDHLTPDLQAKVAEMVTNTFGDILFTPNTESVKEFPSPESLKRRIIISTKPPKEYLEAKEKDKGDDSQQLKEKGDVSLRRKGSSEDEAWGKEVPSLKGGTIEDYKENNEDEDLNDEEEFDESDKLPNNNEAPEYRRLIAIHAGKPKGGLEECLKVDPDKVRRLSLSEQQLEKAAINHGKQIVRFTQRNILRVYPKGTRIDSSNYNPLIGWMHGAQMVAFNMQGHGRSLWLMQGMFRANGGCGYVKKPEFLADSDTKSSESDSDSDSDISSSSYTSSSSDDRRRKRKRSRKDKHRRGKRRDKHREKRRRKQDKRSKRRSRRELPSHTDSDSESKSNNFSDCESSGAEVNDQNHEDHSQRHAEGQSSSVVGKELPPMHPNKREKLDILEEEELPKENGERRSNGTGANYRSERSEGRQPDVMDDQPDKSRSQSTSISPRRKSKSPSISPKRRLNRSPSGSRSPHSPLQRSLSRSPVRSTRRSPNRRSISRNPMRGRKGRSISRSSVRPHGHRSVSTSPVRPLSRSYQKTSPRTSLRRSISRSPTISPGQRSVSASPGRSPSRSQRRCSPSRRSISRSPVRNRHHRSVSRSSVRSHGRRRDSVGPVRSLSPSHRKSPRTKSRRSISRSPVGTRNHKNVNKGTLRSRGNRTSSASPVRSLSRSGRRSSPRAPSQRSISRSPVKTDNRRSLSRSPFRSRGHRSVSASPVRLLSSDRRRSSPRASSRRLISRSPVRVSRRSLSRSPVRLSARSLSRSSGRVPLRSHSRSPVRGPSRVNHRSYSRSPRGRSLSRSLSPDVSPKLIRRGRGFSERYSYARRYRTPSRSPVRSYRYNGRNDRDRYSGYRRYSPRRNRSPPPRRRTPSRFRSRRSRTPSVSRSPRYRGRRYSRSPVRRSPVGTYRPRVERSRSLSRSSRSLSRSRSPSGSRNSVESQSPGKKSRSRSQSLDGKKGLVSYGDGSPDSS